MNDIYTNYYMQQAGSGIGNIYSGPVYQRGNLKFIHNNII